MISDIFSFPDVTDPQLWRAYGATLLDLVLLSGTVVLAVPLAFLAVIAGIQVRHHEFWQAGEKKRSQLYKRRHEHVMGWAALAAITGPSAVACVLFRWHP